MRVIKMKNYLQIGDDSEKGQCHFCKAMMLYSAYTCDGCGSRLVWADGAAAENGEPCPHCQGFNLYIRRECSKCGELLPWKDAAAAKYHASHDSDKEFRLDMISILIGALICVFGFMGLMLSVLRH